MNRPSEFCLSLKKFFGRKMRIEVHPLSDDPDQAYKEFSKTQKFVKLNVRHPTAPVAPNKVRVVCMSDTHSLTPHLKFDIPDGDIFIHAGDFTKCGLSSEVKDFSKWLGKQIYLVH